MIYKIKGLVRRYVLPKNKEWIAVDEFMKTQNASKFVDFLEKNPPVFDERCAYETRYSTSGRISLCEDIYGDEVRLGNGKMIDCYPESYGLTMSEADSVYRAILRIPEGKSWWDLYGFEIKIGVERRSEKEVFGIVDRLEVLEDF